MHVICIISTLNTLRTVLKSVLSIANFFCIFHCQIITFKSICNTFHTILAEPRSHDESMFLISQSENEGLFYTIVSDIIVKMKFEVNTTNQN